MSKARKIILATFLLAVASFIAAIAIMIALDQPPEIKHMAFTEDIPALRSDELQAVFGEYSAGEREEIHIEGESCTCGYHQDEIDYYRWRIAYRDGLGAEMTCELDNRTDIYQQQPQWLEDQAEAHFREQYAARLTGIIREDVSVACRVGDILISWSDEMSLRRMETAQEYRRTLENAKQPIPLHTLGYDALFRDYPAVVTIRIPLDDETIAADAWQANFDRRFAEAEAMAAEIAADTNGFVNMEIEVRSRAGAKPEGTASAGYIYYVAGQRVTDIKPGAFEESVYEACAGKFWE